jgi:hypothetical protein
MEPTKPRYVRRYSPTRLLREPVQLVTCRGVVVVTVEPFKGEYRVRIEEPEQRGTNERTETRADN